MLFVVLYLGLFSGTTFTCFCGKIPLTHIHKYLCPKATSSQQQARLSPFDWIGFLAFWLWLWLELDFWFWFLDFGFDSCSFWPGKWVSRIWPVRVGNWSFWAWPSNSNACHAGQVATAYELTKSIESKNFIQFHAGMTTLALSFWLAPS